MLRNIIRRHLSTVLIAAGLALLAWGLVSLLSQRPNADEQAALLRGEEVSAGMALPPADTAAGLDLFLPSPGVASLPGAPRLAEATPLDAELATGSVLASVAAPGDAAAPIRDLRRLDEKEPTPTPDQPSTPAEPTTVVVSAQTLAQSAPAAMVASARLPANSPPTRIVIPKIKLDAKVVAVGWKTVTRGGQTASEWDVPDYAAGFLKTTAYPGNPGNTVLDGHHNIKGEVFRYVATLELGDQIDLYAEGRKYTYQVVDKFILKEAGASLEQRRKNAQWIAPTEDERLTLVTCWPYWTNTHRVIVIAKPVMDDGTPAEPALAPASQR
jgi:LPXTG-site transpeptidase (sortase) family protein